MRKMIIKQFCEGLEGAISVASLLCGMALGLVCAASIVTLAIFACFAIRQFWVDAIIPTFMDLIR